LKIVAILLLAGMVSCGKDDDENVNIFTGKILFQYSYINYAWFFQHEGFFIDNEGQILTYSRSSNIHPYPDNWHFPDENNRITEAEMNENLLQTEISEKKIDKAILQKYARKLSSIKENAYIEYQNSYDAGASVPVCYLYDEYTKTYKEILLSQYGDFVSINKDKTAKEIDEWLTAIFTE
jgi:hypothetical protein